VFPAILLMALTARAATEERGQLDASPSLFTVMAALDATGYGIGMDSPTNHPLRAAIRAELAKRNISCLPDLKKYFDLKRQKSDTLDLSQYVSWAVMSGGPPEFRLRHRDVDLPPDVMTLTDLSPLLAIFYNEAGIGDLWRRSQPAIEQQLGRYQEGISNALLQVNTYLRQQTSGFRGRRFQVYLELLGPPNQIQTRSYANEYTIVMTPAKEPQIFDTRHAFLHYLLDPLSTRNEEAIMRKRGLAEYAARSGALPESFKADFLLLVTECLIKAVEARLDRQPQKIQEAMKEGYVLTAYFAEALPAFEQQEQAMVLYYTEMVKAIELEHEDKRLAQVVFVKTAKERPAKTVTVPPPALMGAAKTLDEAEELYTARNLDKGNLEKAKGLYLKVLQQTEDKPMHGQAYYGLARIAVLQKDPETGERLFQKTLECGPPANVKAWTLVYLGKLAWSAGDQETAVKQFRSALQVTGASKAALQAAEQGIRQNSKP
jgi:tetratricopeptide (TPR) repeat protein